MHHFNFVTAEIRRQVDYEWRESRLFGGCLGANEEQEGLKNIVYNIVERT